MILPPDRRQFLHLCALGASSIFVSPELALSKPVPADWRLGVRDLEGDLAPAKMRLVHGRPPRGLSGALYRNGPAKFRRGEGPAAHWFDGDGFVRRFLIDEGDAQLSGRFVDTHKRRLESQEGRLVVGGFGTDRASGYAPRSPDDSNASNTNVVAVGNEVWALWEAGSPVRLDPATLATRGMKTLREDMAHMPFLAHPRIEPGGRIWNLGFAGNRMIVWQLAATGKLEKAEVVRLPRASYVHDFTATKKHIIIVLQPWVFGGSGGSVKAGLQWKPELGTEILVLDKADLSRRRMFELPSFALFHLGDAWEEADGTIRFDLCSYEDPTFGNSSAGQLPQGIHRSDPVPRLTLVALRPNGKADISITPFSAEFPRSDARQAGLRRRYTVHATSIETERPFAQGVAVFDWTRERQERFDFGPSHLVEEFVFVPRGSDELNGWLVGTTLNLERQATELHVLDARNVRSGPIASWRAGTALPVGFHGNFVQRGV